MAAPYEFFTDRKRFRTVDTLRVVYLIIFIAAFFLTEFGRHVYRPFVYGSRLNDLGIADSIGNAGGILVQIFFGLAVLNSPHPKVYRVIAFLCGGYILYEIVQPVLPRGVFDWKDIAGTLIGSLLGIFIIRMLHRFHRNRVLFRFGPD